MTFDSHLVAWRRFRGLTQSGLAARTAIPQPNIAALEAGRLDPKLSTVRRLAQALEVSVGKLLDELPSSSGWNRHRIDALVRRALQPAPGRDRSRMEEALRVVAAHKLKAAGQAVRLNGRNGQRLSKQLRADLGPKLWNAVIRRLDKHL
jgi:transcriptional regulator with XRE-family HTH domain